MRPVLDVVAPAREGQLVEQGLVVGAEPREERLVVAALEHVHRVELQQAEALDAEVQLTGAHGIRPLDTEALRRERDATGGGGGDGVGHAASLTMGSDTAAAAGQRMPRAASARVGERASRCLDCRHGDPLP